MPDRLHETHFPDRNAESSLPRVSVRAAEGRELNGLEVMLLQYLEQNLAEFDHKVEAALRLREAVTLEIESG